MTVDTLFTGARVIDPESGLDAVRQVGVRDGTIVHVGADPVPATQTVDVTGLVLSPGFIDLHSHAQSVNGLRLQAMDGVTTSLDLESGTLPVPLTYERAAEEGRPINYGYAASWAMARLHVVDGAPLASGAAPNVFQAMTDAARWNQPATPAEVDRMLALLEEGVAHGALGIGVLLGYSPDSGRVEYFRTAQLASRLGVGVFTHSRGKSNVEPMTSLEGALEIVGAAAGTGASMHICHLNSTSLRHIDEIAAAIETARGLGNRVTTEAYPYTASSTGIGAAFLAPEALHRIGIEPKDITYLPTGERVADTDRLAELRATNPGGLCVIDYLRADEPADIETLLGSITLADTAVASDAMPLVLDGLPDVGTEWPPDARAIAHPRSIGVLRAGAVLAHPGARGVLPRRDRAPLHPAPRANPRGDRPGHEEEGPRAGGFRRRPHRVRPRHGGRGRHLRPDRAVHRVPARRGRRGVRGARRRADPDRPTRPAGRSGAAAADGSRQSTTRSCGRLLSRS